METHAFFGLFLEIAIYGKSRLVIDYFWYCKLTNSLRSSCLGKQNQLERSKRKRSNALLWCVFHCCTCPKQLNCRGLLWCWKMKSWALGFQAQAGTSRRCMCVDMEGWHGAQCLHWVKTSMVPRRWYANICLANMFSLAGASSCKTLQEDNMKPWMQVNDDKWMSWEI